MKKEFRLKCYQRDAGKKQQAEELIEYILDNYTYGQTILDTDLAKILGYNITYTNEFRNYKSFMAKIKEELIVFNYILKAVSGVGYYILKPEHVIGHCYNTYIKASQRKLDKSMYISEHIDRTNLNENRLTEISNFRTLNDALIEEMERMINNSAYMRNIDTYDLKED